MAKELKRGVGNPADWLSFVQTVIKKLNESGDIQSGDIMNQFSDQFAQMAADVVAAAKDGFGLSDIPILSKLVPEVMGIAKQIEGASGEAKKQFVIDTIWVIYHSVDTGPDGNNNRIKIPFLSWLSYLGIKSSEEKVERFILKVATEFAIDAAYPYLKDKGEV
jgi:hypothetical protein